MQVHPRLRLLLDAELGRSSLDQRCWTIAFGTFFVVVSQSCELCSSFVETVLCHASQLHQLQFHLLSHSLLSRVMFCLFTFSPFALLPLLTSFMFSCSELLFLHSSHLASVSVGWRGRRSDESFLAGILKVIRFAVFASEIQ